MKTWDLIKKISNINVDVKKHSAKISKKERLVILLSQEANAKNRKFLYQELSQLDLDLFFSICEYFSAVYSLARNDNFSTVYDWVMFEENDSIDWKNLFENKHYVDLIRSISEKNSELRKKELKQINYYPWDYWYKKNDWTSGYSVLKNCDDCLEFVKEFYERIGLDDIYGDIEFEEHESHTFAQVYYENGKWTNKVYLNSNGFEWRVGTLTFLSVICHEIGHVIQSRLISDPDCFNFLAPNPLIEIVPMFFEKLFLTKENLDQLYDRNSLDLDRIIDELKKENQLTTIRSLANFEFELDLYSHLESRPLEKSAIASLYNSTFSKYNGYDDIDFDDHGWQRMVYYLTYSPFKSRSYVLGDVLSGCMLKHYHESGEDIRVILKLCSSRGIHNTWQDFSKACGIKKKIDFRFILDQLEGVLK